MRTLVIMCAGMILIAVTANTISKIACDLRYDAIMAERKCWEAQEVKLLRDKRYSVCRESVYVYRFYWNGEYCSVQTASPLEVK